jgi:hypothetical protein
MGWLLEKHGADVEANWKLVCLLFYRDYSKYKKHS